MHQQRSRFIVSVSVVVSAVLGFARTGSAQTPADSYRAAAKLYRQYAAASPARATCFNAWAAYYDKLANYDTAQQPPYDSGCSGVGAGNGGGTSGTSAVPSGSGRTGGSWIEGALGAAGQIFQSLGDRQQRQQQERLQQEEQERQQREETENRQMNSEGTTEPGCLPAAGGPMAEMMMKDARRRTGNCQQSSNGSIWLNEGVPGTTYSRGSTVPAGQRAMDPFPEPVIDGSDIPSTIEFPGSSPRPTTTTPSDPQPQQPQPEGSDPVKDEEARRLEDRRRQLLENLPPHTEPAGQRELDEFNIGRPPGGGRVSLPEKLRPSPVTLRTPSDS